MNKIKKLLIDRNEIKKHFFSIEVTPKPNRLDIDYSQFPIEPLFTSITWIGDDNLKYDRVTDSPALKMIDNLTKKKQPCLSHVCCYKLTEKQLDDMLDECVNLFPLTGDYNDGSELQKYKHASDLIQEIRKKKGDDVTIFTSGYPKIFKNSDEKHEYFLLLKRKIDHGADAIITQIVYNAEIFIDFVRNCREFQIIVPILPGIFVPSTFDTMKRMAELTKTPIPSSILQDYEVFKDDEQLFKEFAIQSTVKLMKDILNTDQQQSIGFHFFTMNNFDEISKVLTYFDFK